MRPSNQRSLLSEANLGFGRTHFAELNALITEVQSSKLRKIVDKEFATMITANVTLSCIIGDLQSEIVVIEWFGILSVFK